MAPSAGSAGLNALQETQPAREDVGPGVHDHASAEVAAPSHQRAVKDAEERNDTHVLGTLVCVDHTEEYAWYDHRRGDVAGCSPEMQPEVPAVNNFLADSSRDREQNPGK